MGSCKSNYIVPYDHDHDGPVDKVVELILQRASQTYTCNSNTSKR